MLLDGEFGRWHVSTVNLCLLLVLCFGSASARDNIRVNELALDPAQASLLAADGREEGLSHANFAGIWSHNAVLQRGPARAAVYGFVGSSSVDDLQVLVENAESTEDHYIAAMTQSQPSGTWKALLWPGPVHGGGNYTISLQDTSSGQVRVLSSIANVTFGDVWFCGGQSNMALGLKYTFKGKELLAQLSEGKHKNRLRVLDFVQMDSLKFRASSPQYVSHLQPESTTWLTAPQLGATQHGQLFSATCMYFGSQLLYHTPNTSTPIGLVHGAIGGSTIEAWVPTSTTLKCRNTLLDKANVRAAPGTLYNGIVAPLVNMTVKGFIWYQGENNVEGTSSLKPDTGYSCEIQNLIEKWRSDWSSTDGTTSKDAPFGIVSLASGTSEGHPAKMASFRAAQIKPKSTLPNVFVGHAYDLGDPWGDRICEKSGCCRSSHAMFEVHLANVTCSPKQDWWETKLDGSWFENDLKFFQGPIHPRLKARLGDRLALGALGHQAPKVESCSLRKGEVFVQFGTSVPLWSRSPLKSFQVCTGNASACSCSQWGFRRTPSSGTEWFCADDGLEGNQIGGEDSQGLNSTGSLTWRPAPNPSEHFWSTSSAELLEGNIVAVENPSEDQIYAVRYAWSESPCCTAENYINGRSPCPPQNCGLLTRNTDLPPDPFFLQTSSCLFQLEL